jgi:hypothetical protein
MSDRCTFCEERKPTNHLILNEGALWLEFCGDCGETEKLTNPETEEVITVQALYDRTGTPEDD